MIRPSPALPMPVPRPSRVRVADPSAAAAIRAALPGIPVAVGPTPELDALVAALSAHFADGERTYLDGGRLPEPFMDGVFRAARLLYAIAPWTTMSDDQVVRLDVPELGVEGACLSVIGGLGEGLGLIVFPSLDAYHAFTDAELDEDAPPDPAFLDFGSDWLALHLVGADEVTEAMREEVAEHGWPLAGDGMYPLVERRARDGTPLPIDVDDLLLARALALGFATAFTRHLAAFEDDDPEPFSEVVTGPHAAVRFTYPFETRGLFEPRELEPGAPVDPWAAPDVDEAAPDARIGTPRPPLGTGPGAPPPAARPGAAASLYGPRTPGRNDPCPCGSGRKYKKCHMQAEQAGRGDAARAARTHPLDRALVERLTAFAIQRFGDAACSAYAEEFDDVEQAIQLAVPWSVYGAHVEGRSIVDWYLAVQDTRLPRQEREWLEAQRAAWLSVWEVTAVEPGRGVHLRDMLSGQERDVLEILGSETLVVRDAVLGRVVDHDGLSLLCGVHPSPLPPLAAADLLRRARGRLRRKREVPVERLRDDDFARYLIRRWEESAREQDRRRAIPPELVNTDGDPLRMTTDHFALEPGARAQVAERLATLRGADVELESAPRGAGAVSPGAGATSRRAGASPGDDDTPGRAAASPGDDGSDAHVVHFSRPGNRVHAQWTSTLVGFGRLTDSELRLDTNSSKRADELRARVQEVCGGLIRHRAREVVDVREKLAAAAARPASSPHGPALPPSKPEHRQLELAMEAKHYAAWPDEPVPALGGMTPRDATRTAAGRAAVDALIKHMENAQARLGRGGFDFGTLRRDLELE